MAIGIDVDNGCLMKYGFYKPGFGGKTDCHPITHVKFEGYKIPYLDEAIQQAKFFHSFFKDIHSIGWDIAILENEVCFIEGNDNWEISLHQGCTHGLKKEFDNYLCDKYE